MTGLNDDRSSPPPSRFETVAGQLENDGRTLAATWVREWGEALTQIANADTRYPSSFNGDWKDLRDAAREVLATDELGVWS